MLKNETIHARINTYIEKNITTQSTKISSRFSYSHQDTKWHQIRQNHTKTKINHTKMLLIAPRYETTPNQTKSHSDEKLAKAKKNHTKIQLIAPRCKMTPRQTKSHQDENFNQDGEKLYQDSRDHHKVMTSSITWPHIRMISLKVIKSLQDKGSRTNTQKLDQDIKFTTRRTWQTYEDVTTELPSSLWWRDRLTEGYIWLTTGQHHIRNLMGCCHRGNVLLFDARFYYVGKPFGPLVTQVTILYGNVT